MSLHAQFRKDKETSWVRVTSEVEVEVSHFDPRNPAYVKLMMELTKPVRKLVENNLLPPEKDRQYAVTAFCKYCVKGWRTVDVEGKVINNDIAVRDNEWLPFTQENAVKVFLEYSTFYNDTVDAARDITTFQLSDDQAKN